MLARNVTKRTKEDDIRLHHLCYVNTTKSQKLIGWVGNDMTSINSGMFADAGYAGGGQFWLGGLSAKGALVILRLNPRLSQPNTCFSRRQRLENPDSRTIKIMFHDENQGMIAVVRNQNPTMRHLEGTHGISIQWMHEIFQNDFIGFMRLPPRCVLTFAPKLSRATWPGRASVCLPTYCPMRILSSDDAWYIRQPIHDISTGLEQHMKPQNTQGPTFPFTEPPILPPDLHVHGSTTT